jgi:toxin ParE1/3/4
MAKYQLSNKAVEDLTAIWQYTYTTWSETQADKYYKSLIQSFETLAVQPSKGKRYEDIQPDLLGYISGRHIIFYTIQQEGILIIRVLHSMMDLKRRIQE